MQRLGRLSGLFFGILLSGCLGGQTGDGSGSGSGGTTGGTTPGYPGAGTGSGGDGLRGGQMTCFFNEKDPTTPLATVEHVLEVFQGQETVHVRLTLDPDFVDNTYGEGSLLWGKRGHTFKDIYRSDHAELVLTDASGQVAVQFKLDYLSESASAPSGWASLGVTGGDGEMIVGSAGDIVGFATSIDRNLNERGYAEFISTSPLTDESYTPNPAAPEWDYRYVFEVWVANSAFGGAGFGDVFIEYLHASPSKDGEDTKPVDPQPCPPDWGCNDPDGCDPGDGYPNDPNDPNCNDPDGCDPGDGNPSDPNDPSCNDPDGCDGGNGDTCTSNSDCSSGEFCDEGVCRPIIG